MTLNEAIEEVKRVHDGHDFTASQVRRSDGGPYATAIATILNAVVKGERVDGGIDVGDWWDIVDCRHQQCRGCEKCEGPINDR